MTSQPPDASPAAAPSARWPGLVRRGAPLAALLAVALGAYLTGALHMLAPSALGQEQLALREAAAAAPVSAVAVFVAAYAILTGACLPVALVLSLAGGAIFGPRTGAAAVLLGATAGALLTYAATRSAFAPFLRRRAERDGRLRALLDGFERNAFSYVLMLRLLPIAPFPLVNIASGLAAVPVRSYALATLVGGAPLSVIYAGLGAGLGASLASRSSLRQALHSPELLWPLAGLAMLALAPVLVRRLRGGEATRRRP